MAHEGSEGVGSAAVAGEAKASLGVLILGALVRADAVASSKAAALSLLALPCDALFVCVCARAFIVRESSTYAREKIKRDEERGYEREI